MHGNGMRLQEERRFQEIAGMSSGAHILETPLASILIANYNYAQFLGDAIDSALDQTYPRVEVIVVDDGSTDASRQVMASYGSRITPIHKQNGGHSSAINAGFAACRGEVICLLDSDDVFFREKVSMMMEAWARQPTSSVLYHQVIIVDGQLKSYIGKPWPRAVWSGDIRGRVEQSGGWWPHPTTSGLCFSRSYLLQVLPIPTETARHGPDTYLASLAAFAGPVTGLRVPLAMLRYHGQIPVHGVDGGHLTQSYFDKENEASGRVAIARRKKERYEREFGVLKETLTSKLGLTPSLSLDDVWPYQRCRWMLGDSVTYSQAVSGVVGCRSMPLPMKWREVAKALLRCQDWR